MKAAVVSPGKVSGSILAPASKSAMQRACALALLNNGKTVIGNPGKSNDDLAALQVIRKLGAVAEISESEWVITSNGIVDGSGIISCGESGLSFRMFASIAAMADREIILTGEGSLLKRPMHFFDEVFPKLGVAVRSGNGFLPLEIRGPLKPCNIEIDGSSSSQYLTGLLFAYASAATVPVTIRVSNLKSRPYADLSVDMLRHFGYQVNNNSYREFVIFPRSHEYREINYLAEGDWSAAAFLLVAGAIAGNVSVSGLTLNSVQADRAILDILKNAGAMVTTEDDRVLVQVGRSLQAFNYDATDSPDLFPPLAVLAACCRGTSFIKGTNRLTGKESNRAETLADVLEKMGIDVVLTNDVMEITGGTGIKAATVSSYNDHRIAMACAVAALVADGDMRIEAAEAVDKSYPDFFRHLSLLGADLLLT